MPTVAEHQHHATSTPEQILSAIQRLEARCVRLSKLKTNAEALKEDDEDTDEATVSKRQTLITELVASMKSLEADIVRHPPPRIPERLLFDGMRDCIWAGSQAVLKRFQIEAEAAAIIDGKFDAPVGKKKPEPFRKRSRFQEVTCVFNERRLRCSAAGGGVVDGPGGPGWCLRLG